MTGSTRGYVEGGRCTRLLFKAVHRAGMCLKRPRPLPPTCARVVVVKLGGIGDAVLATPILKPLRQRFPNAQIDVVCWSSSVDVFRGNPFIGNVLSSPILDASSGATLLRSFSFQEILRFRRFLLGAEVIIFINRICTIGGFLKLLLIASCSGRSIKIGLDTDSCRGSIYDIRISDGGYLLKHEVLYLGDILSAIGAQVTPEELTTWVHVGRDDQLVVDRLLAPLATRPFIALHIGSSRQGWRALKRLPLDLWLEFAQRLISSYGIPLVIVGTQEDREINLEFLSRTRSLGLGEKQIVDLADQTTVPQLAEVISRARLFVGTDSGVAHVASSSGTPMITAFLFSDFVGFLPWGPNSQLLTAAGLACAPCLYRKGYASCRDLSCSRISIEDLWSMAKCILDRDRAD